jgi:hypothetical protein
VSFSCEFPSWEAKRSNGKITTLAGIARLSR